MKIEGPQCDYDIHFRCQQRRTLQDDHGFWFCYSHWIRTGMSRQSWARALRHYLLANRSLQFFRPRRRLVGVR